MSNASHQAPCVEDTNEETGSVIDGTAVFASPTKEKPNTGRSRGAKLSSRSSSSYGPTDSDSTTPPVTTPRREKESRSSRDKESRSKPKIKSREKERDRDGDRDRQRERERERPRDSQRERDRDRDRDSHRERERSQRPKPTRNVTIDDPKTNRSKPVLHPNPKAEDAYRRPKGVIPDDPTHFGIQPSRPRASSRPSSGYYGQGSRPPAANERWHTQHASQQQQHHPFNPYGTSPYGAPPPPMPGAYPMPPSPTDYFTPAVAAAVPIGSMSNTATSHLASRFSLQRPNSASGFRQPQALPSQPYDEYYDEDPYHDGAGLSRRLSKSRKAEDDRRSMPPPSLPPPRSNTAGPGKGGPFLPPPPRPPPGPPRLHHTYEDDDLAAADSGMYRDVPSRNASWGYGGEMVAQTRRNRRDSVTYENDGVQLEPANHGRRRHSYMGTSAGSDYQEKLRDAENYQGKISGGNAPLTKESLGKVERQKRSSDKSSRSTRSSGASRDESDYWNSNTTRTTRSFAGDGETNIRIKGGATLRLGEMEIQCKDGGEIILTQDGSTRGGSERGSTIWPDERQRRIDNVPHRPHPASQAGSYTRSQYPDNYESYGGRI